jgi:hypothetical protein
MDQLDLPDPLVQLGHLDPQVLPVHKDLLEIPAPQVLQVEQDLQVQLGKQEIQV